MSIFGTILGFCPGRADDRAPLVYYGSHVMPRETGHRGGWVDLAYIPGYVTRDGREAEQPDDDSAWPWMRLSTDEDPRTYQGGVPGRAAVLLDREQVQAIHDATGRWLACLPVLDGKEER